MTLKPCATKLGLSASLIVCLIGCQTTQPTAPVPVSAKLAPTPPAPPGVATMSVVQSFHSSQAILPPIIPRGPATNISFIWTPYHDTCDGIAVSLYANGLFSKRLLVTKYDTSLTASNLDATKLWTARISAFNYALTTNCLPNGRCFTNTMLMGDADSDAPVFACSNLVPCLTVSNSTATYWVWGTNGVNYVIRAGQTPSSLASVSVFTGRDALFSWNDATNHYFSLGTTP